MLFYLQEYGDTHKQKDNSKKYSRYQEGKSGSGGRGVKGEEFGRVHNYHKGHNNKVKNIISSRQLRIIIFMYFILLNF